MLKSRDKGIAATGLINPFPRCFCVCALVAVCALEEETEKQEEQEEQEAMHLSTLQFSVGIEGIKL